MIRKNLYIKEDFNQFLEYESSRLGISQSALVNIMIDFYYQENHVEKTKSEDVLDSIRKLIL